jgi:hypothetical protein
LTLTLLLRLKDIIITETGAEPTFMSIVTIEIDSKLAKIVRSPAFSIVAALQGISVSFAPFFLYWSGQSKFLHGFEWFVVPTCFAIICLVPLAYFRIGNAVIKELRKNETHSLGRSSA